MKQDDNKKLDRQACIIHCIVTRLSETEALEYLKSKGHNIQKTIYYDEKKKLKENRINFANKLATGGFLEQHVQRIETFEEIEKEYWLNYHAEDNPSKKCVILSKIRDLQPFISSVHDYTQNIILEQTRLSNTVNKDGDYHT